MSRINLEFTVKLVSCWLFTLYCAQAIAQPRPQIRARLSTSDTVLELSAGPSAPAIISLSGHQQNPWRNRTQESLPAFVERAGTRLPLTWRLLPHSVTINAKQVIFVYESKQPHLRLSWEWTARATFGPIEHRIEVENLDPREFWMPIKDSLSLDWHISPTTPLRHFYVEKGAGEPTPIGTHLDQAGPGYRWTGWSTTYAHDLPGRGREIIPYEAVFLSGGNHPGWYAGIEFSGRTRITLDRMSHDLRSQLGLDPEPGPALTRLTTGGSIESPIVFLGAFASGPDGAGNQLRPWVPHRAWFATHLGEPPLSAHREQQLGRRHAGG